MSYKDKVIALLNSQELLKEQKEKLKSIFPEFKESEDERIKKWLIDTIEAVPNDSIEWDVVNKSKVLTWLEKQGEQKFEQKFFINDKVVHKATGKIWTIYYYLKDTNSYYVEDNDGLLHHYRESELKLVEQNPADKVEPKFKVGDWVVTNDGSPFSCGETTLQITDIDGKEIWLKSKTWTTAESIRLWTIQDAKAGDVLYSLDSNQPFIYKVRNDYEQAVAYCGLNIYGKFFVWDTKDCVITLSNYVPATKEQRDLLFQKMKEAGYEWDEEKKELKKIEQKPSWSGEDELRFKQAIYVLHQNGYTDVENWLKSLKERIGG